MRILVFDPFHGAAGDIITGALLDCGADENPVIRAMQAVVAEPVVTRVSRAGIRAVRVDTRAPVTKRTFADVTERLDRAAGAVPEAALAMARRVFERLHAAEVQVHGKHVHFHEVGADDAVADIIGACTALHSLGIDGVAVMPVALGSGFITGSHGTLPVPAPATAAVLAGSGLDIREGEGEGELCTPTGAALLAEFRTIPVSGLGSYKIEKTGYGAGSRDAADTPNVLRAMVVETEGQLLSDTVDILETSVDDVGGEVIACAIIRLMEAGARDASAMPVMMKKGRPGLLIRVICMPDQSSSLAETMARELGTLGIRCIPAVHRFVADRTVKEVTVEIAGTVRTVPVKCGWIRGTIYTLKAEFEPARAWAAELGLPVRDVIRKIEEAGWKTAGSRQMGRDGP